MFMLSFLGCCQRINDGLVLGIIAIKKIMCVRFEHLPAISQRHFRQWPVFLEADVLISFIIPVFQFESLQELNVVEYGSWRPCLKCKISTGSIDDWMLSIGEMFLIDVSYDFVASNFNRHGVPLVLLEIESTNAVDCRKVGHGLIDSCLDKETIRMDVYNGIVFARSAG